MDRSLKIRKQQLTDSTKHPMKQKPKKKYIESRSIPAPFLF